MRLNNEDLGLGLEINGDLRLSNRSLMKKSGSLGVVAPAAPVDPPLLGIVPSQINCLICVSGNNSRVQSTLTEQALMRSVRFECQEPRHTAPFASLKKQAETLFRLICCERKTLF